MFSPLRGVRFGVRRFGRTVNGEIAMDHFTFWDSYREGFERLPTDADRVSYIRKIISLALDGKEPEDDHSVAHMLYVMARPSIQKGLKRAAAGAKGGITSGASKSRPGNANASKTQANASERPFACAKTQPLKTKTSTETDTKTSTTTDVAVADVVSWASSNGVDSRFAVSALMELKAAGWEDGSGSPIRSWRRYILNAWQQSKTVGVGQLSREDVDEMRLQRKIKKGLA